jgi:hypothetical protein
MRLSPKMHSKKKVVVIHQPDFLPWLGFFDRWRRSDLYIVLDDVQFLRRGWHHRDKIKTAAGVQWLTVPVMKKGKYLQLIREVEIDYSTDWRSKHLRTIEVNYKRACAFDYFIEKIKGIYNKKPRFLVELNLLLLQLMAEELGIDVPFVLASDYHVNSSSTRRLVELMKAVEGTHYLSGTGARNYLDESLFEQEGILLNWQQFNHPVYPQLHGDFVPGLSVLDFAMNHNPPLDRYRMAHD